MADRVRPSGLHPDGHQGSPAEWVVGAALVVAIVAGSFSALVYWRGGQTQLEAAGLGIALAGIGTSLVVWARHLLPDSDHEEPWDYATADEVSLGEFDEDLDRAQVLERRPFLRRLFLGAVGALGVALAFPIRSLGPRPGDALRVTAWSEGGLRLVDPDGAPVLADEVPVGGLVTVYPEAHTGDADAVAVLVRVAPEVPRSVAGREAWSPDGFVAYSKLCTHAGCPVGLYDDDRHTLLCPCHQSEFDVLDGGAARSGPAARRLPQLPLRLAGDGTIVATGDFSEPVGPAWWSR